MNMIDIDEAQTACLRLSADITALVIQEAAADKGLVFGGKDNISEAVKACQQDTLKTLAEFFVQDTTCGAKTIEEAIRQSLKQMKADNWGKQNLEQQPFWQMEKQRQYFDTQAEMRHLEMQRLMIEATLTRGGDLQAKLDTIIKNTKYVDDGSRIERANAVEQKKNFETFHKGFVAQCLERAKYNIELINQAFFDATEDYVEIQHAHDGEQMQQLKHENSQQHDKEDNSRAVEEWRKRKAVETDDPVDASYQSTKKPL